MTNNTVPLLRGAVCGAVQHQLPLEQQVRVPGWHTELSCWNTAAAEIHSWENICTQPGHRDRHRDIP